MDRKSLMRAQRHIFRESHYRIIYRGENGKITQMLITGDWINKL
jgi:hypothetical protein